MKLYASVTSERATKGQGGNDYLITTITDKDERKLVTLHITVAKSHLQGEHYNIYLTNHQSEYIDITNGKEKCVSMAHDDDIEEHGYRLECQRGTIKGEKQKGDCSYATEDTDYCETHHIEH
jgi:hypothetical protein